MTAALRSRWESKRLKYLAEAVVRKAEDNSRAYVGLEHIQSGTGKLVEFSASDGQGETANAFQPDDVLFGKLRPYLAKTLHATFYGRCTSEALVLRPRRDVHARYLAYLCLSAPFLQKVNSSTYGAKMPRANWRFIGNVEVPAPPKALQEAIAAFLDRKTAAVDALIEKKERLIALLQEKRQALITQAVTKGLDPNVPMKDSGIEWLGEVPAHWEIKRLKHIAARLQGRLIVQPHLYFADEGVPIVFGYNIKEGTIDESGLSRISYEADRKHQRAKVRAGDLLTVRLGAPGVTAVVPPSLDGCHFASIMWIHQHGSFHSKWLCHCMNSSVVQYQIRKANYGAAQTQFNIRDAVNFRLPVPPVHEQKEIASHLDRMLQQVSAIRRSNERQIELLREYRQALITDAVTGKLDISSEEAA